MNDGADPELQTWAHGGQSVDTAFSGSSRVVAFRSAEQLRPRPEIEEALIRQLMHAMRSPDLCAARQIRAEFHASGVVDEALAERYVPEAARRMGDDWDHDRLGFAEVSIGIARLQGLLREIEADAPCHRPAEQAAPAALMVLPLGEHHTLGAMVATGRLRRQGISVRLSAGHEPEEIRQLLEQDDFDMILVTWARHEGLESLRSLIQIFKSASRRPTPVVVGGTITGQVSDIEQKTGADYATSDIDEAVRLCGLTGVLRSVGAR